MAKHSEIGKPAVSGQDSVKGAQTLMRALDILDEVIDGPIRAVDLSRKLQISKTTAHRLAQALHLRGYLSVTKEGFALGPKLLQLGALATEQIDPVRLARPFLERLSDKTGFCAFLGKREGDYSRHLDRVTGRQRLRVATAPGDRRAIAETGLGKALLLDEEEAEWRRLYREASQRAVPEAKMKSWLRQMLVHRDREQVRHDSELGDGVRSIASPVRNASGDIFLAISIASAAHYLTEDIVDQLADAVAECAAQISAAAGYEGRG